MLLLGRVIFAVIKPASLALSIFLVGAKDSFFLSALISIVPISTAAMSLPVHRKFYLTKEKSLTQAAFSVYIYSFFLVLLIVIAVMAISAPIAGLKLAGWSMISIGAILVTDKIFDELMRWNEFKKSYVLWLILGLVRNVWSLIFIFFVYTDQGMVRSQIAAALPALGFVSILLFANVHKLSRPSLSLLLEAKDNLTHTMPYYIPTLYRGLARGIDKLLLNLFVPSLASIYVTFSLAINALYIVNDAFIIAPNRRLISRRPYRVYSIVLDYISLSKIKIATISMMISMPIAYLVLPDTIAILLFMVASVVTGVVAGNLDEISFWAMGRKQYVGKIVVQLIYLGLVTGSAITLNWAFGLDLLLALVPPLLANLIFIGAFHHAIVQRNGFAGKKNPLS